MESNVEDRLCIWDFKWIEMDYFFEMKHVQRDVFGCLFASRKEVMMGKYECEDKKNRFWCFFSRWRKQQEQTIKCVDHRALYTSDGVDEVDLKWDAYIR